MVLPVPMSAAGSQAMLPPREISVSAWAEENLRLSGAAAAEKGVFRCRPYQREPMDVLSSHHPAKKVVLMWGAQLGKTTIDLAFVGYIADIDPGPTLLVEPKLDMAKDFSKDRLAPLFRNSPALRNKIAPEKSRSSDNSTLHKSFVGGAGHITFVGANSPSDLAGRPIRYLILDETDRYKESVGREGDPCALAERRTDEFEWNKKIVYCSTPTIRGFSEIERQWMASDQREWFVPCPLCEHEQPLVMGDGTGPGLVWPEGRPKEAKYRCASCQCLIPHYKKAWMEERGRWIAQNPGSEMPGFHLSQLHAPKRSWTDIAAEFLTAKKSPETLKTFMNTVLAELWEERHDVKIDAHGLLARSEIYAEALPASVAVITLGADVQADRLVAEIVGWGRDEESWSLGQHVIPGDTERIEAWRDLDELLKAEFTAANGGKLRIRAACIDCGYKDAMVLRFTRERFGRRIFAVKGRAGALPIWPRKPSRKHQSPFFIVGVDAAKDAVYDRLRVQQPGPGYCHFPAEREFEFFEELTSEKKYTVYHNGFARREWRKDPGARNEALDCRVYAYAALHALYSMGLRLNREADRLAGVVPSNPQPANPTASERQSPSSEQPTGLPQREGWFGNRAQNWFRRSITES